MIKRFRRAGWGVRKQKEKNCASPTLSWFQVQQSTVPQPQLSLKVKHVVLGIIGLVGPAGYSSLLSLTHTLRTHTYTCSPSEREGEREREFPVQNTSTHIQPGDKLSRIISLSRAEGGVFCRLTRDGERENILLNDIPEVYWTDFNT